MISKWQKQSRPIWQSTETGRDRYASIQNNIESPGVVAGIKGPCELLEERDCLRFRRRDSRQSAAYCRTRTIGVEANAVIG